MKFSFEFLFFIGQTSSGQKRLEYCAEQREIWKRKRASYERRSSEQQLNQRESLTRTNQHLHRRPPGRQITALSIVVSLDNFAGQAQAAGVGHFAPFLHGHLPPVRVDLWASRPSYTTESLVADKCQLL